MTYRAVTISSAVLLSAIMGVACSQSDNGSGGPLPSAASAPEAKDFHQRQPSAIDPPPTPTPANASVIFTTRCATCHGVDGKGTGPAAQALNPKPRDYSDAAWQKSVTDEQIAMTIVKGGAAMGKSPLMAANPDLEQQPVVVEGLVKMVRGFAKPSDSAN